MKFEMCFKNVKNMQFNGQIFKICNHVNMLPNFGSFNNILGLYKQKEKAQKNFYITKILKDM